MEWNMIKEERKIEERNRFEKMHTCSKSTHRNLRYLRCQNSIPNKMIAFRVGDCGILRTHCIREPLSRRYFKVFQFPKASIPSSSLIS